VALANGNSKQRDETRLARRRQAEDGSEEGKVVDVSFAKGLAHE